MSQSRSARRKRRRLKSKETVFRGSTSAGRRKYQRLVKREAAASA